ncbi:hypothetical protein [Candidatus Foliamicus sp.]
MTSALETTSHALMKPPVLGALAWTTVLLWTPLAHTLMVLQFGLLPDAPAYLLSFIIGLAGWVMVWKGFKVDDLTATVLGFMGGGLIWLGWMEGSFEFMGHWLNPAKLMFGEHELFTANLLFLQATGVILVALLIWLGSNKDTHCRMFMWYHRNLKLTPARRTPGYKRQFSRIVALEVVMINWFFYVLILWLFDPRVLGPFHPATIAVVCAVLLWGLWLLFFRMLPFRRPAAALRYAVPSANVLWFCVEAGSAWQLYTEPWIYPFRFPVTNLIIALAFAGGLAWFASRRGAESNDASTA